MRVISAVFIAETSRVVSQDTELTIMKKKQQSRHMARTLQAMFCEMDASGDFSLTREELLQRRRAWHPPRKDDTICWLKSFVIMLKDFVINA